MRISRLILLLVLAQLLSGCSWLYGENGLIKNNEYTFIDSKMGKKLIIPEGLKPINIVDKYPIPAIATVALEQPYGKDLEAVSPTLILAVDTNSGVYTRAQNKDPTVWFRISELKVWQALVDYLKTINVPIAKKDIDTGTIETDWIVAETDSLWNDWFGSDDELKALRAKYRFTVVKSSKGKLTLLSVKPLVSEYMGYDNEKWLPVIKSREGAIVFMNGFLGTWAEQRALAARARVFAANKGISLSLGKDNNDHVAFIAAAKFNRVWERLAYVAKTMGMEVDDKDQSQGIYYMKWSGKASEGFFESLKFWGTSGTVDLPLAEGEYQFNLSALGDKTAITIAKKEGSFLDSAEMNKLFSYFEERFSQKRKMNRH